MIAVVPAGASMQHETRAAWGSQVVIPAEPVEGVQMRNTGTSIPENMCASEHSVFCVHVYVCNAAQLLRRTSTLCHFAPMSR